MLWENSIQNDNHCKAEHLLHFLKNNMIKSNMIKFCQILKVRNDYGKKMLF